MSALPLIRLCRITSGLASALDRGVLDFEVQVGAHLRDNEAVVRDVVRQVLAMPTTGSEDEPWGGYLTVDVTTSTIIGTCAFKSRPTAEGKVEIAYFTFPAFERLGYATAMAERLITLAGTSPLVRSVIAHTLPERNPSTRVLEKVGMQCLGDVIEPEDGRVWRWQREARG